MADMYKTIDELLAKKGVSGAKMASDLGMSRSFITELRKGRAKSVKLETAQKIADYFRVPVEMLLGEETKKSPDGLRLTEGEKMLIDLFRKVPEDRQQLVIQMIRAALGEG